jgi:hypothetical protein
MLISNVYLPNDTRDDFDEVMMYFGKLHYIVTVEASNMSSVYIVGDWNACLHGKVFWVELHNFCSELNYVISDRELVSDSHTIYTYVSEAHITTSWLDHCVTTSLRIIPLLTCAFHTTMLVLITFL